MPQPSSPGDREHEGSSEAPRLVIVGTGEWARMAHQYFSHDSEFEVVAFSAERTHMTAHMLDGLPIVALDELEERYPSAEYHAFVATSSTGLNRLRTRLFYAVAEKGYRLATYVSSRAYLAPGVKVGKNCLIAEMTVIQPFTTIGDNVFMHSGNVIGHGSVVEDHCFITSHVVVAAHCHVGRSSFIGLNATFNDNTSVAEDSVVTSCSLIAKKLTIPARVYHGSPATAIEGLSSQDVAL